MPAGFSSVDYVVMFQCVVIDRTTRVRAVQIVIDSDSTSLLGLSHRMSLLRGLCERHCRAKLGWRRGDGSFRHVLCEVR